MKSIINANQTISSNSPQIALLKNHFPSCFDKHGAFMPHKLQEMVEASGVALSREGYSLNWLGKSYARLLANENVRTLLKANLAHNHLPENVGSNNMLIKGDNLEVLKHLMGAYAGKVKMIYIDPPYNTGSDGFVYADDRKFTVEQLSHLAGIEADEAKRILEFTSRDSNSHSAWLTFMYPRLYLAKQLLRDDGVIFISIDDNEQAQLKLLMDEVFGEENFLGKFVVNASPSGLDYGHIASTHDYAYFYAKNVSEAITNQLEEESKEFRYNDKHGGFNIYPLYNGNVAFNPTTRPNLYYPFYLNTNHEIEPGFYEISLTSHEGWVEVYPVVSKKEGISRVWRWGKTKSENGLNDEIIGYRTNDNEYRVVQKSRHTSKVIRSLLLDNEVSSRRGTGDLEQLFDRKLFSFPKPVELVRRFIEVGSEAETYVLDFFAGSGTTAHAVMQLNAEDGGNRQFICVQIDEPTDPKSEAHKAGYKTIYDITAERIKRAASKIKAAHPETQCDFGFKQFETIPVFEGYLDEPDELTPELELFNANQLSVAERHSLMLTWQAHDGIALNTALTPLDLAGYPAYQGGRLVYFIEPDLSLDAIVALLERLDNLDDKAFVPSHLVVFGSLLNSKTQREMTEAVKQYNNRKGIELTLDVRF
jgi:adenine-specific DNA-methyltransferase